MKDHQTQETILTSGGSKCDSFDDVCSPAHAAVHEYLECVDGETDPALLLEFRGNLNEYLDARSSKVELAPSMIGQDYTV